MYASPLTLPHHPLTRWTGVALCALGLVALSASLALAQLPNFSNVEDNMQNSFAPLITLIRFVIMAICIVAAIVQGYKAANGSNSSGYIAAVLLLVVAGFAATPSTWVSLFGLTDVALNMGAWGL